MKKPRTEKEKLNRKVAAKLSRINGIPTSEASVLASKMKKSEIVKLLDKKNREGVDISIKKIKSRSPIMLHKYDTSCDIDIIYEASFDNTRVIYRFGRRGTKSLLKDHFREFDSWNEARAFVYEMVRKRLLDGYRVFTSQDDLPDLLG